MLEWFGEFFATLPDAAEALWLFGDPEGRGRGWFGLFVAAVWGVVLIGGPLAVAKLTYGKREWVSAATGVLGGGAILWWIFGIIPSAWQNFTSSEIDLLEHAVIPSSLTIPISEEYRIDIATDLYNVVSDSVVALLMVGGIVLGCLAALRIQKQLPKQLAPDESRPEAGGYR